MELKRYQRGVLDDTQRFLARLAQEQTAGNKRPSLDAWETVRGAAQYRPRRNGLGRDLPDVWLKVPTGGGKTLLATQVLGQIHATIHRDRNGAGLALWIVPSDAIYQQTLKALRNRSHDYRMALEQAVGRRVEVWEKHEAIRITPSRLLDSLNLILIKMQSANREDRETLKLFKDAGGNIVQHFPGEDDAEAHRALKRRIPNLEMVADDLVKTSVGNLVRLCEPPVIIDEGHRLLSEQAQGMLADFNPSILIRLSATPPDEANVLVKVTGQQLLDEEMIKLPINVVNAGAHDWKGTLSRAHDKRRELEGRARRLADSGAPFIRPIALVQVERTGEAQEGGTLVHAEHVKDYLMSRLGVAEAEIKIKSSERDDIEGLDLLDEGCTVRWIITKSALQEGWDCPYAYVLASLSNTGSARAMTQLVGRVLRQPNQRRTAQDALNESYVFCRRAKAAETVREVKKALEKEGYEGHFAGGAVRDDDADAEPRAVAKVRPKFRSFYRKFEGRIYLPRFCVRESGRGWSGLDYFAHLISTVDVSRFHYAGVDWGLSPDADKATETLHRVTLGEKNETPQEERPVALLDDDERTRAWLVANRPFDHLGYRDLHTVVGSVLARVLENEPKLAGRLGLVKYALRERMKDFVQKETDRQTEAAFLRLLTEKRVAFYLECTECRFELPTSIEIRSRALNDDKGRPLAKTLFEWADEEQFNEYEREIALVLDKHPEVLWWYRNAVGEDCFSIQGYRKERIFPDFVVQRGHEGKPTPTVIVVESKGLQLKGDPRTVYTRNLAKLFEQVGRKVTWQALGEGFADSTFRFQVIDQEDADAWRDRLDELLRR